MNALLKPVNAIKVLFLLFFLSTIFFVASCKKNSDDEVTPRTELQNKIKGTWNVDSMDYKFYQNNTLDSANSFKEVLESDDLLFEFKGGGSLIATQKGSPPQTFALTEEEDGNSFIYSDGYDNYKAVISLNGDKMTWVETATGTENGIQLKGIFTMSLTKKLAP